MQGFHLNSLEGGRGPPNGGGQPKRGTHWGGSGNAGDGVWGVFNPPNIPTGRAKWSVCANFLPFLIGFQTLSSLSIFGRAWSLGLVVCETV